MFGPMPTVVTKIQELPTVAQSSVVKNMPSSADQSLEEQLVDEATASVADTAAASVADTATALVADAASSAVAEVAEVVADSVGVQQQNERDDDAGAFFLFDTDPILSVHFACGMAAALLIVGALALATETMVNPMLMF